MGLSTISENKTFLVTSAKLLKEGDDGLALVEGADPPGGRGDLMSGPLPPSRSDGGGRARTRHRTEMAEQPNTLPTARP